MMNQQYYQVALNKYAYELLQERYQNHINILSRMGHYLVTEDDIKQFTRLLGDIYEKAYAKSLKDCHDQLEKAGLKVSILYNK